MHNGKETLGLVTVPCMLLTAASCAKTGMAGDRGMRYPELTKGACQHLNLPANCTDGYSSSRTCEINMSQHSGINFRRVHSLCVFDTTRYHLDGPSSMSN